MSKDKKIPKLSIVASICINSFAKNCDSYNFVNIIKIPTNNQVYKEINKRFQKKEFMR